MGKMRSLKLRIAAAVAVVAGGLGVLSSTPVLAAHSRDKGEVLAQTCGNAASNFNAGQGWFQVPGATVQINDEHKDNESDARNAAQGRIQVPGAAVTIKNDDDVRNVVTTFSVDANIAPGAMMLSTFTVDGGAPVLNAYGPGNLGGNQPGMNQRTIENVIPLGKGTHTIYAWVQVSGNWWNWGQTGSFCLVAKDSEEDD
jgi:hypothetical protein